MVRRILRSHRVVLPSSRAMRGRTGVPSWLCKDIETSCIAMMLEISTFLAPAWLFWFLVFLSATGRPPFLFFLLFLLIVEIGIAIGFFCWPLLQFGLLGLRQRRQVFDNVSLL